MKYSGWLIAAALLGGAVVWQFNRGERQPLSPPLPASPPFTPSAAFDGEWQGERFDESGDSICLPTAVVGTIKNGAVKLKLSYNNTYLLGWISEQGELVLYSDSLRWGYRFTGQYQQESASSDQPRIAGHWRVTNALCQGTWYVAPVNE